MIEKSVKNKIRTSYVTKILGHIYTMLAVILLWVLFRADSVKDACAYIGSMFGRGASSQYAVGVTKLYAKNAVCYFVIAIMGCMPCGGWISRKIKLSDKLKDIVSQVWIVLVFLIACCMTIDSNYNPFIYFNF